MDSEKGGKYHTLNADEISVQKKGMKEIFLKNALPGLTVALVSIPLSTALSIAAGATPDMGLRSAIYGPAIGGILGGSDFNILGPAGALVNINKLYSGTYGVEILPWLAFVSGLMALLVWLTKLENTAPSSQIQFWRVSASVLHSSSVLVKRGTL